MSTEAKLEELKARQEATNKRIAELEQKLAEEKKPKLRHGDYGFWRWNRSSHYIIVLNKKDELCYQWEKGLGVKTQRVLGNAEDFVILGNAFDDIKSMQEDVTAFAMEATGHENTCGTVTVGDAINPRGLIFLSIERNDEIKSTHLTDEEFEIFTKKCQSKLATLKRRKK